MIEVFKTNIANTDKAGLFETKILLSMPQLEVNFDLEDCDKILRVTSESTFEVQEIENIAQQLDIFIEILED